MNVFELCGWVGAILVLIAYYMVTTGKAKGESIPFQMINISGATLLVVYTYNCQAYASMIVNIIWVAIGATSFTRFIKLSSLKLKGRYIMKTKTKAFLAVFLLAIVAISTPVSAFSDETSELYAQSSESEESDSSVYDEDDSSEESPSDSEESSTESTEEEEY